MIFQSEVLRRLETYVCIAGKDLWSEGLENAASLYKSQVSQHQERDGERQDFTLILRDSLKPALH